MEINNSEIMNGLKELRDIFDKVDAKVKNFDAKFNDLDGFDKEKVQKINETLNTLEEKNQEILKKIEEERVERETLKVKAETLESQNIELIKNLAYKNEEVEKNFSEEDKNFIQSVKFQESFEKKVNKFQEDVSNKTIRTDINIQGGFLVHPKLADKIFKEASEISKIEQYCTIFNSPVKSLRVTVEKDSGDGKRKTYFTDEAMKGEEETESWDFEELTAFRQSITVGLTRDELMFSEQDVFKMIKERTVEKFGKGAGFAWLDGVGDKIEGLLTSTKIKSTESSDTGTLDFDDVITLPVVNKFKSSYADPAMSKYYFNLRTLMALRILKDTQGQYLWSPAAENKAPSTINGFGYVIVPHMEDVGSKKTPIIFGDLRKAYSILNASSLSMIRDEYTKKKQAIVEFTWDRWLGGKVILGEAVQKLVIK